MTKHETPILFIDRGKIRQNYLELKDALPPFRIAYAIKSNSHPEIIEILRKEGSHFETASVAEIEKLLALGVKAEHIVLSNPVKAPQAIRRALEHGVSIQSFDSVEELEKFKPHAGASTPLSRRVRPQLRIVVPNEGSMWPLSGKFGADEELWPAIFQYMKENEIPLDGVTFHPGSQCETIAGWDSALYLTWRCIEIAREYGLNPTTINIGGGLPVPMGRKIPTVDEVGKVVLRHLKEWERKGFKPADLIVEPGRFISGSAGVLASKIIGVARREKTWAFMDCGVFTGMMETIDGITYPMLFSGTGTPETAMLCGPSCDSVDKMYEAQIPKAKPGDAVLFLSAGAYTSVYASEFNGFLGPKMVFLDEIKDPKNLFELLM
ncbi:MAG TPA: type III PLP-dependent enzyme [Turneriella sp.]|nr:type III PLP-dependent enzyme [Turneriella sp.]HNL53369.1 type III PLP-dependent enzyme [Turneriella sp.]